LVTFRFDDAVIETRKGDRRALVVTPTQTVLVGRARLQELRRKGAIGQVDRELVERVNSAEGRYDCVVFRGRGADSSHYYRLDETLDEHEFAELARRLIVSKLPCWRSLLERGVPAIVHTEFGSSAMHLRNACRELAQSKSPDPNAGKRIAEVDVWLLAHMVFFFSQNYDATMGTLLPDKLPLLDLRRAKVEGFAQQLREASAST
jgi:hypothetical protein